MNRIFFFSSASLLLAAWLLNPALDYGTSSVDAAAASARTADAITAAVQTEIDRLNKEQEELQVAHDSAIENLETLTACRGAGRFVHQPPVLPGGQATGGQDG